MTFYTLQDGPRGVLPVPPGLRELASDLAREVMRAEPSNLLGFAADYMAALLRTRSSAIAAAEAVGTMLNKDVSFATLLAKRGVKIEDAQRACVLIQSAFRGYCARRNLRTSGDLVLDPVTHKHAPRNTVTEHAVSRIQAAFRGYMVRKILHNQKIDPMAWLTDDYPRSKIVQHLLKTVGAPVANEAATKIQAVFRGYSVRQGLQATIYEEVRKQSWKMDLPAGLGMKRGKEYTIVSGEDIMDMETDEEKAKLREIDVEEVEEESSDDEDSSHEKIKLSDGDFRRDDGEEDITSKLIEISSEKYSDEKQNSLSFEGVND